MKTTIPFLLILLEIAVPALSASLSAAETAAAAPARHSATVLLKLAGEDPLVVDAPDGWTVHELTIPGVPIKSSLIGPPITDYVSGKVMISVIGRNKGNYSKAETLKDMLRRSIAPYLAAPGDEEKFPIKTLKIQGGLGFYANCKNPDPLEELVNKNFPKSSTPVYISIGEAYLISASIHCDDLQAKDYQQALQLLSSIRVKK